MSIENNLKRIADALENLTSKLDHIGGAVSQIEADEIVATPKPPAAPPVEATAMPPAGTPTPSTTTPTVMATPVPPVKVPVSPPVVPPAPAMSPEELNVLLIAELSRLGGESKQHVIRDIMKSPPFNAVSVTELTPEQYAPLIAAVQAVKA